MGNAVKTRSFLLWEWFFGFHSLLEPDISWMCLFSPWSSEEDRWFVQRQGRSLAWRAVPGIDFKAEETREENNLNQNKKELLRWDVPLPDSRRPCEGEYALCSMSVGGQQPLNKISEGQKKFKEVTVVGMISFHFLLIYLLNCGHVFIHVKLYFPLCSAKAYMCSYVIKNPL